MNTTPLPRPPQYSTQELIERRSAKKSMRFRRQAGALAVMAAIAIPGNAAGGARAVASDAGQFVGNRIAMIKDAFGSDSVNNNVSPQTKQLSREISVQETQNQAGEIQAETAQIAAASEASGGAAVIEMPQGK